MSGATPLALLYRGPLHPHQSPPSRVGSKLPLPVMLTCVRSNRDATTAFTVDNKVAMALMLEHIKQQMALREGSVRQELKAAGAGGIPTELPSSISVLEPTLQVRGMHTIIRNVETSREDFVFYSERLMRSLFEHVRICSACPACPAWMYLFVLICVLLEANSFLRYTILLKVNTINAYANFALNANP